MTSHKSHLGDGAYIDYDGFGLVLTTENGIETTNTIYLEPEVWVALVEYVDQLRKNTKEEEVLDR